MIARANGRGREHKTRPIKYLTRRDLEAEGVGLPRSSKFLNDFENSMGSNGKKRQKAAVQVQSKYSEPADLRRALAPLKDCTRLVGVNLKVDREKRRRGYPQTEDGDLRHSPSYTRSSLRSLFSHDKVA
jgi:hypothetical protein